MKKKRFSREKMISDLNITNLVDVVFTLLIIFMITAPMMTQGVQIELPKADARNVEVEESIQVSINAYSEIYIDQQRTPLLEFNRRFRQVFAGRINIPVFISADKKVPYGLVMRVISDVQNAGVVKIGFITEPLKRKG